MEASLELMPAADDNQAAANEPWPEVQAPRLEKPVCSGIRLYRVSLAGTAGGVAPAADGGGNGGCAPFPAQIP